MKFQIQLKNPKSELVCALTSFKAFCGLRETNEAIETAKLAIKDMGLMHLWDKDKLIFRKDKSLNERDYGDLVGLNKEETIKKFGKDQVHIWRRSFDICPPGGESLKMVLDRVNPYYDEFIYPEINEIFTSLKCKLSSLLITCHPSILQCFSLVKQMLNSEAQLNPEVI